MDMLGDAGPRVDTAVASFERVALAQGLGEVRPGEALQVAGEAKAFFITRGVDLGGEQQTRTRSAPEQFATTKA
jgi:hypothetical protein